MRRSPSALLSLSNFSTLTLCILILSTLSFAAAPDRITGPIVSGQLVKLSAGVPMRAKPQYDQGPVDPSLKLNYITLQTVPSASQQKAIDRLLAQQQDPSSPLYHKWLTPEQYADRFALSPNDIQKLTAWLQSQGFTIVKVARSRNLIAFSGTAAQAENAFRTEIHNFAVGGEKHFSNTTPPSIPAALAGVVAAVGGLNDFRPKPYFQHRKPDYSFPIGNNEYVPLLAPGDIATIYDINPLYTASPAIDGTGQKLVVVGQTDVYLADLNDFRSGFFPTLPLLSCTTNSSDIITACDDPHFKYVLNSTADPGVNPKGDDLPESDLDLEWSGAIAYNAQIIFVNSGGTSDGVWDAWHTAITDNLAPVITMSYGICELGEALNGAFSADTGYLQQASSQGITFMNSSGDSGAAGCDDNPPGTTSTFTPLPPYEPADGGLAVNYPASSPEVTGVGGTMIPLSELTDPGTYWTTSNGPTGGSAVCPNPEGPCIPENGWNDDQEFGDYCAANPSDTANCDPKVYSGQVPITGPQTFQEDWWILSSTGGPSNCYTTNVSGVCTGGFPQPAWQQNLSILGQTTKVLVTPGVSAVRFTPDVSLLASADFPGYIICTAQSELGGSSTASSCDSGISNSISEWDSLYGGTSFASPIFAGIVTLLNQYVVQSGFQKAPGLSNANPTLYQIATYNPSAFHQVTAGDNYAPGSNTVYYCAPDTPAGFPTALQCPAGGTMGYLAAAADSATGYNLVTGLGSVDANNLATAWGEALTATTTSLSPSAASIIEGASETLTITVTPPSASGIVTLYDNGSTTALGTATITGGAGTFTTTALTVGSNSITGTYVGTDATSTSSAVIVTVTAPTFTFVSTTGTATSHTVLAGQTSQAYSFTATPTSASTFAAAVTFSCSFSPADPTLTNSSCAFTPSSIPGGGTTGTTPVSMTITSAGPNHGTGSELRHRTDNRSPNRSPWLPLTLPIAGVVVLGLMRGKVSKKVSKGSAIALLFFSLALLGFMIACGGGSSTPPPVTVTVSPNTVQLYANETGNAWPASATQQQFSATVNNSSSQSVTWAVTGTSANGAITSAGLYSAPATVPSPATVTVTATSAAATTPGSGTVDILTPTGNGALPAPYIVTVTATEGGAPATNPSPTVTLTVQ